MTDIKLKRKFCIIRGKRLSYIEYSPENPKSTLILFPGGYDQSSYFIGMERYFPGHRLLFVDYPGRGESDSIEDNSFKSIASYISGLITSAIGEGENVTLVGLSFGSCIVHELIDNGYYIPRSVVLITPGEFFSQKMVNIIKAVFFLPSYSGVLRRFIRWLLVDVSRAFGDNFPKYNLKDINEQWISAITYKLNAEKQNRFPALIFRYNNDSYVTPESNIVIEQKYPNHRLLIKNGVHSMTYDKSIMRLEEEIYPDILNELTNGIIA